MLVRVYLTAFQDVRSRKFVGWYVTLSPNSMATLIALRRGRDFLHPRVTQHHQIKLLCCRDPLLCEAGCIYLIRCPAIHPYAVMLMLVKHAFDDSAESRH